MMVERSSYQTEGLEMISRRQWQSNIDVGRCGLSRLSRCWLREIPCSVSVFHAGLTRTAHFGVDRIVFRAFGPEYGTTETNGVGLPRFWRYRTMRSEGSTLLCLAVRIVSCGELLYL